MMDQTRITSPGVLARSLQEFWAPGVIAELEDSYVKVAKLKGSLTWHKHDNEDELFFVLKGSLTIELEGFSVELGEGDLYVVPKGVLHNPVAESECHVMLIERKNATHTGNVKTAPGRTVEEQLRVF
jgi:mannose-6-phosphate isomerase-like protein (cupin superfamily)